MNLQGRNFLKLLDYSSEEIRYLLDLSKDFKEKIMIAKDDALEKIKGMLKNKKK